MRSGDVTYVSVYLSANDKMADFRRELQDLEDCLRRIEGEAVTADDFNAKVVEWVMDWTNSRGAGMVEMAARLDLT